MELFYLFMGIFTGIILCKIISILGSSSATGTISVDHESGLCRFFISSNDLSKKNCKKAVFIVDHNAIIRDENNDYNE